FGTPGTTVCATTEEPWPSGDSVSNLRRTGLHAVCTLTTSATRHSSLGRTGYSLVTGLPARLPDSGPRERPAATAATHRGNLGHGRVKRRSPSGDRDLALLRPQRDVRAV